jgi:hypothetical protein
VIYSEHDGIVLDDICPTRNSVSKKELEGKGNKVIELLQRIENEAAGRRNSVKEKLSEPINGQKN